MLEVNLSNKCWYYQRFLSVWEDLLRFLVPGKGGGTEEIAARLLFARGEISTLADTKYRCDEDWLIFWQQS